MKTITIDGIEYQLTPVTTEAPKPVQWEPSRCDRNTPYWFLTSQSDVSKNNESFSHYGDRRASFGNYFHTEQEAEEAAKQVRQLLRLRAYVREFAFDWKADWSCRKQLKWYVYYNHEGKKWYADCHLISDVAHVYMPKNVAIDLACKLNSGEVVL